MNELLLTIIGTVASILNAAILIVVIGFLFGLGIYFAIWTVANWDGRDL